MVLRQADQEQEFLSELEHLRQRGLHSKDAVRLTEASSPRPVNVRARSMLAVALGLYFLVHGLPLLAVGLVPGNRPSEQSRSSSEFSPKQNAKIKQVIRTTFSSPGQFKIFLIATGGGLTASGAVLYFWGLSKVKKNDPKRSVNFEAVVNSA